MKLWLVRHAKSDWNSAAASDFERPLNARGERDGPRMAHWLAGQTDPAGWIWTSDAARALATTRFVTRGFATANPEAVPEHRLYLATASGILDVIRGTPPDQTTVAVVGHNPGMTELLNRLTGSVVTDNLPTFGIARLEVGPWAELAFESAVLDFWTSPKRLA